MQQNKSQTYTQMEYDRKGIVSPWGGKNAPLNKQYYGRQTKLDFLFTSWTQGP